LYNFMQKKNKKTAKETEKKPAAKKRAEKTSARKEESKMKYFEGVGRRKTATAVARLFSAKEPAFIVNNKKLEDYFPLSQMRQTALSPLEQVNCLDRFRVWVRVRGGGLNAQSEAIRLSIARALSLFNPAFSRRLKKLNYLTRDPRMKERKKFGLKRARRAPQWSKR